ncbi:MAG: hypothetical protein L0H29_00270 [Sinobacteraceae bacterium]|nr:hypothetical protein [Nevskiaceae bacterium]
MGLCAVFLLGGLAAFEEGGVFFAAAFLPVLRGEAAAADAFAVARFVAFLLRDDEAGFFAADLAAGLAVDRVDARFSGVAVFCAAGFLLETFALPGEAFLVVVFLAVRDFFVAVFLPAALATVFLAATFLAAVLGLPGWLWVETLLAAFFIALRAAPTRPELFLPWVDLLAWLFFWVIVLSTADCAVNCGRGYINRPAL